MPGICRGIGKGEHVRNGKPKVRWRTRERQSESSHKQSLRSNEWLPDNHSPMQCFSKFSPPTAADPPTI